MEIQFEITAKTDIGRQRSRNEDNFLVLKEYGLAVVADGMGGHVDGDVASQIAVDTIRESYHSRYKNQKAEFTKGSPDKIREQEKFLIDTIKQANENIVEENHGAFALDGMGTTVVTLQIVSSEKVILAWVGDSRIYCLRDNTLKQVTQDHSLMSELARHNLLPKKDLIFWQNKNIITRALGMASRVEVDTAFYPIQKGDVFILCTDGLTDYVADTKVQDILLKDTSGSLEKAVEELIEEANNSGGPDNITVALVKIL